MFLKLIDTENHWILTITRLILGVVFFAHGAQKLLGWFGGDGFQGTMQMFVRAGVPAPLAFVAIVAEFFGGLGLIVGLLARIAALGIFCNMIVAIALVHSKVGFFMNWTGTQKGEGFEYHLLVIALCLGVLVKGAGAFSFDLFLRRHWGAAPFSNHGMFGGRLANPNT
jgi:putative oxidoreductase